MKFVRVLAWILFAFAALGVVAYYDLTAYALTVGFAALAPYLMLVAVPSLLLFAIARRWLGVGLSLLILIFLVVTTVPLYVADDAPSDARALRVLTINVRLGQADPASIVRAVKDTRADFLMLEELTAPMQTSLAAAGLDTVLPHHASEPEPDGKGTGLWSRFPIERTGSLRLSLRSIVVRATVPGLTVRPTVVALHVAGPFPVASLWVRDMGVLSSRLRALPSDAPVVVAGDFNATHSIGAFRNLLEDGYEDAGDQAGAGLLRSYPATGPVIGIDHVITRGGVGTSVRTVPVAGTDHLGLLAVVALPA